MLSLPLCVRRALVFLRLHLDPAHRRRRRVVSALERRGVAATTPRVDSILAVTVR